MGTINDFKIGDKVKLKKEWQHDFNMKSRTGKVVGFKTSTTRPYILVTYGDREEEIGFPFREDEIFKINVSYKQMVF